MSPEIGIFQFNLERAVKREKVLACLRQARSLINMSRRYSINPLIFRGKSSAQMEPDVTLSLSPYWKFLRVLWGPSLAE
jgi:hypothetical protein